VREQCSALKVRIMSFARTHFAEGRSRKRFKVSARLSCVDTYRECADTRGANFICVHLRAQRNEHAALRQLALATVVLDKAWFNVDLFFMWDNARDEPLDDEWSFVAVFTNSFNQTRWRAISGYVTVFISNIFIYDRLE